MDLGTQEGVLRAGFRCLAHCCHESMQYAAQHGCSTGSVRGPHCPSERCCRSSSRAMYQKCVRAQNTVKFGGSASPPLMWEMQHRARGLRITDCYQSSVVRSSSGHFAIGLPPPFVRCAQGGLALGGTGPQSLYIPEMLVLTPPSPRERVGRAWALRAAVGGAWALGTDVGGTRGSAEAAK